MIVSTAFFSFLLLPYTFLVISTNWIMKWTTIYLDIFPALQFVPLVETMIVTFVVEWLSVGWRPSVTLFFFIFLFEGNKTQGVLNMKLPTWAEKEGYWSSQFWKESKDPAPHFSQEIIRIIYDQVIYFPFFFLNKQ